MDWIFYILMGILFVIFGVVHYGLHRAEKLNMSERIIGMLFHPRFKELFSWHLNPTEQEVQERNLRLKKIMEEQEEKLDEYIEQRTMWTFLRDMWYLALHKDPMVNYSFYEEVKGWETWVDPYEDRK